jgi:hypothetical protein
MDNLNFNYRGFPRRNIVNDRRYGVGQTEPELQRLNDQITSLRHELQTLSSSVLNLYNISQTNGISISNIENTLNHRYNRIPRGRPFYMPNRINSLHEELIEIERLTNLVSRRPVSQRETRNQTNQTNPTLNPNPTNINNIDLTRNGNITANTNPNQENITNSIPGEPINNTTNLTNTPRVNSQIESVLFNSLVDTLNNELNLTNRPRPTTNFIHPNILEVTYTPENVANIFRNMNYDEDSTNVITTHSTISQNTEIIVKQSTSEEGALEDPNGETNQEENQQDESDNRTLDNFCVICHENINEGQVVRKIKKCGHCFHIGCLDRWLENKITCPTCRADIRLNMDNEINNRNQPEAENRNHLEAENRNQPENQTHNIINSQINIPR